MIKEEISEYYLERYALGELPDEEAEDIGRLVSLDPVLQAALDEIESSNREILSLYSPLAFKSSLMSRMENKPRKSFPFRRVLTISSVAAALLILILVLPVLKKRPEIMHPAVDPEITLVKGIPSVDLSITQLLVYRQIQDQVEILTDGDKARPGDLLQLAYVSTEESYGMILSIDGRGLITLHFPVGKGESTQLEPNKQFLLPNAIELDDAPGFERFFFITSESPIDVSAVLRGLEDVAKNPGQVKQADLALPENLKQYSILILKGEGL